MKDGPTTKTTDSTTNFSGQHPPFAIYNIPEDIYKIILNAEISSTINLRQDQQLN